MATCITHEPNHEISGYRSPLAGNFVCDVCGPYCVCNEDMAECVTCGYVEHYEEMVYLGHEEYECEPCNNRGIEEDIIFTTDGE